MKGRQGCDGGTLYLLLLLMLTKLFFLWLVRSRSVEGSHLVVPSWFIVASDVVVCCYCCCGGGHHPSATS